MNTKNLLVSFVAVALMVFMAATVVAADGDYDNVIVTVEGMTVDDSVANPALIAGETVEVKVYFDALKNASDVTVEAEIECDKEDVQAETKSFDVELGNAYKKVLSLVVPYDLKDEVSDECSLNIKISGDGTEKYDESYTLDVQRESYSADIKSVSTSSSIDAGEVLPVDVVIKNVGYNDLDDVYVKVSVPQLGVEKTAYFGDLVYLEDEAEDDDDVDTVSGRLLLSVPYDAVAGTYTLNVEVSNDDAKTNVVKQFVVTNELSDSIIVGTYSQTVAVGENAEYKVMVVNPTNKLKVYRLVTVSADGIVSGAQETVVAVPAGSTKTETITAKATSEGKYAFNLNVLSGEKLVDKVELTLNAQGKASKTPASNSVVVLTVALAIVFLVLLVVLIVLVTKKPAKSEEFGESYY